MAQVVVILGAGASVETGAPLMHNFLDVALRLYQAGRMKSVEQECQDVFQGMAQLQRVAFKAKIDQTNLEAVFAAFEMAELLGTLGNLDTEQVSRLSASLTRVIAAVLEQTVRYDVLPKPQRQGKKSHQIQAPASYMRLAALVETALNNSLRIAVVTFNYDPCVDLAFERLGIGIDYSWPESNNSSVKLYKLHGSVLWTRCSACGEEQAHSIGKHLDNLSPDTQGTKWNVPFELSQRILNDGLCCGRSPQLVIVPPSPNKGGHHKDLQRVWRGAACELSEAETIIVAGYSLPSSDAFFRYLYGLGSIGNTWIKNFLIFDPAVERTSVRFRELLGDQAAERLRTYNDPFSVAADKIGGLLRSYGYELREID